MLRTEQQAARRRRQDGRLGLFRGLFLGASLLLVCGAIAAAFFSWMARERVPDAVVLVIDWRLPDADSGPTGDSNACFDPVRLHELLERARRDERVRGLVLRSGRSPIGLGRVEGVRGLVREFRRSGKPVWAFVEQPDALGYALACAAEQVWSRPNGSLQIAGLSLRLQFQKEALAAEGYTADLVRVGRFDCAWEQWTSSQPTPWLEQATEQLAEGLFAELVRLLARSRKIDESAVRAAIDRGMLPAREALRGDLIDGVASWVDFRSRVESGTTAGVEFLDAGRYHASTRSAAAVRRVAVVSVDGVFDDADGLPVPVGARGVSLHRGLSADRIVEALAAAETDPDVAGIILRVESPGGLLSAADRIWSQVESAGSIKPVVAVLGEAGSGAAFYVASAAQIVVAQPGTVTGAIGVLSGKLVRSQPDPTASARPFTFRQGRRASLLDANEGLQPEQRALLEERVAGAYREVVARIAKHRKMSHEEVESLARGRLWTGRQARQKGLVDTLGGLPEAIASLRDRLGLDEDAVIDFVEWPPAVTTWERLGDRFIGGLIEPAIAESPSAARSVAGMPDASLSSALARWLDGRRCVSILPFAHEVR